MHKIHNKQTTIIDRPMIIGCCKIRNINLSNIARAASGSGIHNIIGFGFSGKIKTHVSRDATIEVKNRSIQYVNKLKKQDYRLVALEQTNSSVPLPEYEFNKNTVLVVGSENNGVPQALLNLVDDAIEIPMFGLPSCHNVATATAMAVYEYCRQFPEG